MTWMTRQMRRLMLSMGLLLTPALAVAAQNPSKPQGAQQQQQQKSPGQMMDVEELNDNINTHKGKKVTVAGEIENKIGTRSFVMESGGIFDDEIVVIVPQNSQGLRPLGLSEDANIVVTGTVRSLPVIDVEREYGWDLDPELEVELEGTRNYLVADSIRYQQQ